MWSLELLQLLQYGEETTHIHRGDWEIKEKWRRTNWTMHEALSTTRFSPCWMIFGASTRKRKRLESGIIWRFTYSYVLWLILAAYWDLSLGYYLEHLLMTSCGGWLGFFTAWWLDSKSMHPRLYHIVWCSIKNHIASLSDPDHIDSALNG